MGTAMPHRREDPRQVRRTMIGARYCYVGLRGVGIPLCGRAAPAHDFNPDHAVAPTFLTLPGSSFVISGVAQARDAALTTASAEVKWRNGFAIGTTFEGEFSNVTRSHAGKGIVRYVW
jgi:uncharacterized protein with beta-barrel porin domain